MPEKKPLVPGPRYTGVVCSVCGLDWKQHTGKSPGLEECVRLLKAELEQSKRRTSYINVAGTNVAGTGSGSFQATG